MTCHPIKFPDGATGHVCDSSPPAACWQSRLGCKGVGEFLCDYRNEDGAPTCDRVLCADHRYQQDSGDDFCSIHDDLTALRQPVVTARSPRPAPAPTPKNTRQPKLPGME